jgi:hypothetical protein
LSQISLLEKKLEQLGNEINIKDKALEDIRIVLAKSQLDPVTRKMASLQSKKTSDTILNFGQMTHEQPWSD